MAPHLDPLPRESLPEFEPIFQMVEGAMGFLPNSLLTMARWPELLQAFAGLAGTVNLSPKLDPELRSLVAFVTSNASGCRYCQAHTSHGTHRQGVDAEKLHDAFAFETSDRFDGAERAALRLARDAALVPSRVGREHFDALRAHFDDDEILAIVAVISLFGWLNRWNDTLATTLEDGPLAFGREHLAAQGWDPEKHA